jgi:hypothetical protein
MLWSAVPQGGTALQSRACLVKGQKKVHCDDFTRTSGPCSSAGFFSKQLKPRRADGIARCLFDKKLCCCDRRRSRRRYNGRGESERSLCGMSVMGGSICIFVLSRVSSLPSAGPYSRVCTPLSMSLFLLTMGISPRAFLLRTIGVDSPSPRCLPGLRMGPAISLALRTQPNSSPLTFKRRCA